MLLESLAFVQEAGLDALETLYLVCFFLGLGFAIVMGLMAGVFGSADLDMDAGGDMDGGGGGEVHFSPMSPVVLSTFVSTFGGAGIIYHKLGWSVVAQIPAALSSALVVAAGVFALFYSLMKAVQHSSEAKVGELVGTEAQVITPITLGAVGEISYVVSGSRYTAPAKSKDGKEIGRETVVKIVKIAGNIYYVERVT